MRTARRTTSTRSPHWTTMTRAKPRMEAPGPPAGAAWRMAAVALLLTVLGVAGCRPGAPDLDTRTFRVEHMPPLEVRDLVEPYVYADRPDAPGVISVTPGAVTVRETPDNLAKIERVLAEYDTPRQEEIRLRFQLIEANGASTTDPAIAEVTEQLRELFRFDGYRLVGEAVVLAGHGAQIQQSFSGSDWVIQVGRTRSTSSTSILLEGLELWRGRPRLETSGINVRVGQTIVIGSASTGEDTGSMILTVTAESAEAGADTVAR